jgi:hypothetical protein
MNPKGEPPMDKAFYALLFVLLLFLLFLSSSALQTANLFGV